MHKRYKALIYSTLIIIGVFCFFSRETLALNVANTLTKYHLSSVAVPIYKYVLNKNPKNYDARMNLSDVYFESGQGIKALKLLDVDKELAGNFYPLYLNACAYLTANNMIEESIELLNSAPGFYARTKISHKRPPVPELVPKPGIYDKKVSISSLPNSQAESVYIKINNNEYILLNEAVSLPFGEHNIYAVSVDTAGIISEVINAQYVITKPVLAVQKDILSLQNDMYLIENDTLT